MARNAAAAPYEQVSRERLMRDTEALARWVRLSGTPEELEAFRYAQQQLRAAGCKTQLLMHDAYISLPGPASLELVDAGASRAIPCITHSFAAPTDGVEAPAVYAATPSDLPAAQAAGRIAILDGLASPVAVQAGQAAGAVGLVFLNRDPHVHEMIVSTVWGSPPADALDRLPRIPVVSVAGRDADAVRAAARDGRVSLRIRASVDTGWRRTPLLVGDLPGAVEDTFIMFSGHMDS
jgi:hypothetical protein